jgi:hypothetical protein
VKLKERKGSQMITCGQCGKVNGHGEVGKSWICEDCKADEENSRELKKNPDKSGAERPDASK